LQLTVSTPGYRPRTAQAMVATRFSSSETAPAEQAPTDQLPQAEAVPDPVLCLHCGRTATNGISCEGACVADSGY